MGFNLGLKGLINIHSCRSGAVKSVQKYGYPCKANRHCFTLESNVSRTAAGNKWCIHAHSGSFSWPHSSNYVSVCIGQTQWLNTSMVIRARDRIGSANVDCWPRCGGPWKRMLIYAQQIISQSLRRTEGRGRREVKQKWMDQL